MSCLVGILGRFWNFVKNFFEGYTSPPPRSAFAPPVPLCNEPGCFDYFTNLLYINLLQQWYTCFCVATSVKISVFGVYFWRGGFVYILRKWIFYFAPFLILFCFVFWFVLLSLIRAICPIVFCAYCQPWRGGVTFDSLVNVPRYHVIKLPYYLQLQFEVSKTCHVICAWRFEDLPRCEVVLRSKICNVICALCVVLSCFAVEDFAVVGVLCQHHTGDTGSRPLTLLT